MSQIHFTLHNNSSQTDFSPEQKGGITFILLEAQTLVVIYISIYSIIICTDEKKIYYGTIEFYCLNSHDKSNIFGFAFISLYHSNTHWVLTKWNHAIFPDLCAILISHQLTSKCKKSENSFTRVSSDAVSKKLLFTLICVLISANESRIRKTSVRNWLRIVLSFNYLLSCWLSRLFTSSIVVSSLVEFPAWGFFTYFYSATCWFEFY